MAGSPNRLVEAAIQDAVASQGEIGIQVAAYLDGELVVDAWGGVADERSQIPVDGQTLFCAFSVTKAVTAAALLIQADRGLVDYTRPIAQYWPEFAAHGKEHATIYDALTHRLGIPMMPSVVSPELMCDWDWMVDQIARMRPLFEPGTRRAWHSYTFGWIIGEIVRRTDPAQRPFGNFVQEEICQPLGITDLWLGIPDGVDGRIARLRDMPPLGKDEVTEPGLISLATIPPAVAFVAEVYERTDVRRACIAASGGIMNARSCARVFAALSLGGELDGVRLLSGTCARLLSVPAPAADFDYATGRPTRLSLAGFVLGDRPDAGPTSALTATIGSNLRTFCHPGAGGQIAWADPDAKLAVAILRNRMIRPKSASPAANPLVSIANAVRGALGLNELASAR